jgi:hypothetical protein
VHEQGGGDGAVLAQDADHLPQVLQPLVGAVDLTGRQWEQLGTSVAPWVLLPLVLGVVRLRRREID